MMKSRRRLKVPTGLGHQLSRADYKAGLVELTKRQMSRWQDSLSELVHDLIASRDAFKDDARHRICDASVMRASTRSLMSSWQKCTSGWIVPQPWTILALK